MKMLLASILILSSVSSFAVTKSRALKLVQASKVEMLKKVSYKVKSANEIQVNYSLIEDELCFSTVNESMNKDGFKRFTIDEGACIY